MSVFGGHRGGWGVLQWPTAGHPRSWAWAGAPICSDSLSSSLNVSGVHHLQIRFWKYTHPHFLNDKTFLFFLLIVQEIFDFCISKSHQIIEGLHSCRIWHMLTVHWMVFPVHHVEFLSQVLAGSSLRISLLPLWQADYSTKMWDHVPLLSLIIEPFFLGISNIKRILTVFQGMKIEEEIFFKCIYNVITACSGFPCLIFQYTHLIS